jgi:hypothetical protein
MPLARSWRPDFDKGEREFDEKHFNKILTMAHRAKLIQKGYF